MVSFLSFRHFRCVLSFDFERQAEPVIAKTEVGLLRYYLIKPFGCKSKLKGF